LDTYSATLEELLENIEEVEPYEACQLREHFEGTRSFQKKKGSSMLLLLSRELK
jgi:ERCC4-type nuclease